MGISNKLLKEQGPDAPGGPKSYLVDGKLSGDLRCWPIRLATAMGGIMTLMVNQDGTILQKDLGDDTINAAKQITAYNPDDSWEPAE